MAASVSTSADTAVKSASSPPQSGSKALLWVLFLVLVVLFVYQRSASNKEQVLDQNFYRILYETGHSFSIRLQQLRRLHSYNKPAEVIRTQFPTYNEKNTPDCSNDNTPDCKKQNPSANSKVSELAVRIDSLYFELLQQELLLHQCQKKTAGDVASQGDKTDDVGQQANYTQCFAEKNSDYQSTQLATVSNGDVLPRPKGGFSLLLVVDHAGKVLASSGEDNAISFSRFDHVIQALTEDAGFSLANLFKAEPAKPQGIGGPVMPGVSRHVEINLSYGRYRVYLYPLPLADNFSQAGAAVKGMYMIGLLPEQSFAVQKHDIAGFKLMLLSVVSLLFLWTFLKVCLLPQHQAVPRWLISLCYLSGFAMFSLLVATLAVFFIHNTMLEQKTQAAFAHANHLNQNISTQFAQAFNAAQSKAAFFQAFATAVHNCEPHNVPDCIHNKFSCTITQKESVLTRQPGQCQIDLLGGNYSMLAHQVDKEYLKSIGESDSSAAWKFGLFHQSLAVSQNWQYGLSSEATMVANSDYLLNTTVVNKNGNSSWPAVYFAEHNSALRPFSLSHRDYFKRVKTNSGWTLQFEQSNSVKAFTNSYVQRLFNIDSGTRGTTISMPFAAKPNTPLAGSVLIADVFLPALNITAAPHQDFTYMVVDKVTGAILYHSDNERSLIENVFFAGPDASTVKDFVQRQSQTNVLDDHYHGRSGRFVKQEMLMPDWQLLVFFPAHSLTLYSLVWFVILTLVPFISLVLIWLVITGSRLDTGAVKQLLHIPKDYRRRWLFLQLALLLSVVCAACSYALVSTSFSCWQLLPWLIFGWLIVIGSSYGALSEKGRAFGPALANSNRIFFLLLLLCLPAIWYLSQVQVAPKLALQNYYQQWRQLDQARERKELMQAALYLYPNATTQRQLPVSKLLHVTANLSDDTDKNSAATTVAKLQVEALPVLSSASGYSYFWQMIRSMLHDFADGKVRNTATPPPTNYVFWFLSALLILLLVFVQYVERFLGARLCLSSAALRQLSRLVQISAEDTPDSLSDKLLIKFKAVSLQGVDITAVLQVAAHQFHRELEQLLQLSRVLLKWQRDVLVMPSLKLHLELASDGLLIVKLSDIEVSLERRVYRDHLLELLQEFKALVLAGKLAGLTLESGFHSFQHLAIKDAFKTAERQDELDHAEYLIWSECLMDFKVMVPERFKPDVDPVLLSWEARWCPHVRMLLQHDGIVVPIKSEKDNRTLLQRLFRGIPDEGALLAVQSYMLCHADAFYRFKWENCTKDEQLALYNLALGHQLNPLNITLIQNLALNGLLRVHRGRLKLINNSFQQFVLNAEPQHKLQALVHEGEAGVWQQHRLTFAAIILTLLVAVAMTSGHSLHLIAVSVAGVLSTLVSVFSNANVLRSQFR